MLATGQTWDMLQGCCQDHLPKMPADTFHTCVTSPPYFALRDYKVAGQIGLEKSPDAFIAKLVDVFGQVRRVLRPDGVCWVNVGDSYSNESKHGGTTSGKHVLGLHGGTIARAKRFTGMKPLDLCMIPARLALALQADGWYLRASIVWRKPAPMPESVSGWRWQRCRVKVKAQGKSGLKYDSANVGNSPPYPGNGIFRDSARFEDCPGCKKCESHGGYVLRKGAWRPTRSHEMIYMLTKTDCYFADGEAVRTKAASSTLEREQYSRIVETGKSHVPGAKNNTGINASYRGPATYAVAHDHESFSGGTANLRDVWKIGPEPLSLPHFAAFPSALPTLCLKASTSERGCCPKCGSQWARVIERESPPPEVFTKRDAPTDGFVRNGSRIDGVMYGNGQKLQTWRDEHPEQTIGWRPTCSCGEVETVPALVLDPFAGAGTTILAARRLGLRAIGIELNPTYVELSKKRIVEDAPLFNRPSFDMQG